MLLGSLATTESLVSIDQTLGSLPALPAQRAFIVQQQLPLGHSADGGGISVAGGDEGGVDVCPSRCAASTIAAFARSTAQRM